MPSIDFAVTTVARAGPYIHELFKSLGRDLPIRLIVGAPDSSYLQSYRSNRSVEIFEVAREEWGQFENRRVRHRATWNYWRTLVLGSRTPTRDGLLVFEDDITLAQGWERRLYDAIEQIDGEQVGRRYVLTLYKPRARLPSPSDKRTCYVPYPVEQFYGTQAVYYPQAIRADFANYLKANGVDAYRIPYDLVLKEFLKEAGIPLFATFPCLAQHIGEISTGLSAHFHRARRFQLNAEPTNHPQSCASCQGSEVGKRTV